MEYEPIIGLEIHSELNTKSKMFCSCRNDPFVSAPNENVCPVCLGMPGTLPVINKAAVDYVLKVGLALNCSVSEISKWDRKNYFYPDLPKGYQISQYDLPLCGEGEIEISSKKIRITRVHLEEDTGKLIHPKGTNYSLVDYNRAGVPLMELVTEPDIRSGEEAKEFAQELQLILKRLGVASADMEKGEMRVEVNISLRETGEEKFGTKVEIKNLNSFRAVEKAINFEIKRQEEILEEGEKVVQETRGWNEDKGISFSQRIKETAEDYRYFPEPDLPGLEIDKDWSDNCMKNMPELPNKQRKRYAEEYDLSNEMAKILVSQSITAKYFEKVIEANDRLPKLLIANWLIHENVNLEIKPEEFAEFLGLIDQKKISGRMGKVIVKEMGETGKSAEEIISEKGLASIGGEEELEGIVSEVIKQNEKVVNEIKAGKRLAISFLVGQVMKETQGQADPVLTKSIIEKRVVGEG